jgi:hypothetical protein
MTYFKDLSRYEYLSDRFARPNTLNIGWLGLDNKFPTDTPSDELLDLVWSFCKISIAQTRGVHECEFCKVKDSELGERKGEKLLLGTSEIRVFAEDGTIYAAPTLIYHYILKHSYQPPYVFIAALRNCPNPQSNEYFEKLNELGFEWDYTTIINEFDSPPFRL